jgi:hypothetical protein
MSRFIISPRFLSMVAMAASFGFGGNLPAADDVEPVDEGFGQEAVEAACQRAVGYLLGQQWASGCIQDLRGQKRFAKHEEGNPPQNGVAMTALAIMGLASVGHQPSDPTSEGKAMRMALDFVLRDRHQNEEGYFGQIDGSRMYGHGIITLMLAEMVGMGVDEDMDRRLREKCQRAVDLIVKSQRINKDANNKGGWRYEPHSSDSDLSVTVWQVMALRSAKNSGLEVPAGAVADAVAYVARSFRKDQGAFGYIVGQGPTYSTAAEGLLSMQVCGRYDAEEVLRTADFLLKLEPRRTDEWFYYGTYYYAQGMAQRGGEYASTAKRLTSEIMLRSQGKDGSWRTTDRDNQEKSSGPVYSTSLALLSLSIHHNFLPIYQR